MNSESQTRAKRLLLLTSKLGYQTRSFAEAAQKLGVEMIYATDRCHQLDDPWNDRAIAVHFEEAEAAAYTILETLRGV
jgi:nicotinamidase-related amidase